MSIDHSRPVIISAQELLARGYSRRAREHAERAGQLYRVRHGVYALASELPTGPDQAEAMLEMRSRAAAGSISPGTALSHTSALVLHGLPVHDLDTRRVTTTRHRPGSGSRRGRSSICHNLDLAGAVTEVDGIPVTFPARTIVDVARSSPFTGAVCAADEALRRELCSPAELADELDAAAGRVGIARARAVVAFADAGAQSVLESVSRVVISRAGLPMPQLQREFILPDGTSVYVDMYWEEWGLVGEADGTGKYGIDDGEESVRRKLRDEKKRQNDIESLGNIVRRWQWEDYQRGRIVPVIREAMRIQESLGRGPGRAA
ncbi:MAG: type IV toxin-antitoxin system AbiEi family antitoxin domain-containing protein [Dietzia sp.]